MYSVMLPSGGVTTVVDQPPAVRAEGIGHGAAPLLERFGGRRVIVWAMGDEAVRGAFVGERALKRIDVLGHVGPGIDHRHVLVADDVDAGAFERERARIVGDDAADQGCDPHELAIVGLEGADERYGHQFLLSISCGGRDWILARRSIGAGCERWRMSPLFFRALLRGG